VRKFRGRVEEVVYCGGLSAALIKNEETGVVETIYGEPGYMDEIGKALTGELVDVEDADGAPVLFPVVEE
jgi:hypothetical protein